MKLFINNQEIEESSAKSDLTLLRYLRENRSLTGTKEGCASGDCGACTVLVAETPEAGQATTYKSINACITPLYALAGKHVITVEHLADADTLHPAQQTMVDKHGSQCGYCTPGFVMSLAGLFEEAKSERTKITRHSVCDAISGNLCRCTGYRPIVDAGLAMNAMLDTEASNTTLQATKIECSAEDSKCADIKVDSQPVTGYFKPSTEAELQSAMRENSGARIVAGGTDLMLEVTQRYSDIDCLIDVSEVDSLTKLELAEGYFTIGASVTYSQLEHFFKDINSDLFELFERIASRQIRNRGTVGGNIANASPIADLPPVLLALEAELVLTSSAGVERTLPINDFYKGYKVTELKNDEYIKSIRFSENALKDECTFLKVSKRIEDDISSVMLASRFKVDAGKIVSASIAYGGMAAVPLSVTNAETTFINADTNDQGTLENAINMIKSELTPMTDVRASAQYRLDIACSLLRKSWMKLNGQSAPLLTSSAQHAIKDGGYAHA